MPIMDFRKLEPADKPELIFGLAAAVGTALNFVTNALKSELETRDYEVDTLHLSQSLAGLNLKTEPPSNKASEYRRIQALMDRGNELRQISGGGEALALMAAARINELRPDATPEGEPPHLSGRAFILRQLKHPDEVHCLRRIYGSAFQLIGVYSPRAVRRENLVLNDGMDDQEADRLIARDEGERQSYGQQLRETFHLSDVFIELAGHEDEHASKTAGQLSRYLRLLFNDLTDGVVTPTIDEYGMYLAYASSLRSADLSRQVGAAILTPRGEVISLGTNEVPAAGGGQYWEDGQAYRDCDLGYDSNTRMKRRIVEEIIEVMSDELAGLDGVGGKNWRGRIFRYLESTRIMDLTEFGRAVHAEMEAVLSAARLGIPTVGNALFTTTFPCHNCAKHIVGAGLRRVIYIEPYPPSLSKDLHGDAISFEPMDGESGKVVFAPFVGVAPRLFASVFSLMTPEGLRLRRKNSSGELNREELGLRVGGSTVSYIDLESAAAMAAAKFVQMIRREEQEDEPKGTGDSR